MAWTGAETPHCSGTLVVHRDGQVAFCSAELGGGHCPATGLDHHSTFVVCTAVVPPGAACPRCGPVPVSGAAGGATGAGGAPVGPMATAGGTA